MTPMVLKTYDLYHVPIKNVCHKFHQAQTGASNHSVKDVFIKAEIN